MSPSELLNGRQIRTKLDALMPSPAHVAQGRQAAEATKAQQGESSHPVARLEHSYEVGAPCYALYCGPKRNKQPRWVPAVVTKVFGTRSVNVRVLPRGPTWRRHVDQLRLRYGADEDQDPGEVTAQDGSPRVPQDPVVRPRGRNPRLPSNDQYGSHNPRCSERIRRRREGAS